MARFDSHFKQLLQSLARDGRLRHARCEDLNEQTARPAYQFDLRSNDYLGLSQHPALARRASEWASRYGSGAGASRLVSGTTRAHERVEQKLADLKGTEAALLFPSGWQANASVLAALLKVSQEATGAPPLVFTDRLNHASLQFACAAAGARQNRFRHNDMTHLEDRLKHTEGLSGLRFIVTESVFSMDGDRAPLKTLRHLADQYYAFLYIDDAHATGILGEKGRGLACAVQPDLILGTCGKALGSMGAFIAGSRPLCDWISNRCSGYVFSTAISPMLIGAIDAALDLLPSLDADRARVAHTARHLAKGLNALGFDTGATCSQIVPVILGKSVDAMNMSKRLKQVGILTTAIRPPTVPAGSARLRLAVHSAISEGDADAIAAQFATIYHPDNTVR